VNLNIFKVTTFVLAVASLLLPWVSSSLFLSDGKEVACDFTFDYSFAQTRITFVSFQNKTLESHESIDCYPPFAFPLDIVFQLILDGRVVDDYLLAARLSRFYGFSVCFMIVGLLLGSIWQDSEKTVFWTSFLLLFLGTVFGLLFRIHRYKLSYDSWMIAASSWNQEVFCVSATSLGVGFFMAILCMLSLVGSCLAPKFVRLPVEFDVKIIRKLKEPWVAVPKKERLPTIFMITLLTSFLCFLVTVFPLYF
jgi:hypothetical protein